MNEKQSKKTELVEQIISTVDEDMSEQAKRFYNHYFPALTKELTEGYIRGDTLCSLGWTFGSLNKGEKPFDICRSYTKSYDEKNIELFYIFRKRYHSLANFCVWPADLNTWRGYFDGRNQGDYVDIFLDLVRSWYLNPEKLPTYVFKKFQKHKNYFLRFGQHETGWISFVEDNYFASFCNTNHEVKDIFASPTEYKKADAPVVGAYHFYGEENVLPGSTEDPKQASLNYIYNSIYVWDERADELLERRAS